MKLFLAIFTAMFLTGCSTIADTFDRQDVCQTGQFSEAERVRLGRPVGYQAPEWCKDTVGTVRVRSYIRNDGTYVRSHTRTAPDGNRYNNKRYK